jgi:hypothetical protein
MNEPLRLPTLLNTSRSKSSEQLRVFAVIALGVIESLASGVMTAGDAIGYFFNAENCLYVGKRLKDKAADEIMGRGAELPDLFDALAPAIARRQFRRELEAMRALSLKLLKRRKRAA